MSAVSRRRRIVPSERRKQAGDRIADRAVAVSGAACLAGRAACRTRPEAGVGKTEVEESPRLVGDAAPVHPSGAHSPDTVTGAAMTHLNVMPAMATLTGHTRATQQSARKNPRRSLTSITRAWIRRMTPGMTRLRLRLAELLLGGAGGKIPASLDGLAEEEDR